MAQQYPVVTSLGPGSSPICNNQYATATEDSDVAHQAEQGAPPQRDSHCLGDLITGAQWRWAGELVCGHLTNQSRPVQSTVCQQARLALFQACTATKQLVLGTAEHATIKLHVSEPLNMATLLTIRGAMQTRGKLRTKLELSASDSTVLTFALGWLSVGMTLLDELTVEVTPAVPGPGELLSTFVLSTIGRCCPTLRALTLRTPSHELPSPVLFPKLQELTVLNQGQAKEGIVRTCAAYVKQLTVLRLSHQCHLSSRVVPLLLSPGNAGTHLHTLRLPVKLNDTLLGLLLRCTPALEELHVNSIDLRSDAHAAKPVQWRQLECADRHVALNLSSLARLPMAPALELVCKTPHGHVVFVCDMSSADAAALAGRLIRAEFTALFISPGHVAVEDEPSVLRAGLNLIRKWCPAYVVLPAPRIGLEGWVMSTQLMLELRALPHWDFLCLGALTWLPEPQPYMALLHLLPDSYTQVRIDTASGLTGAQVESICLGAPVHRTAEVPLRIVLLDFAPDLVLAIQHRVQLGPYPHVVVDLAN